MIERRQLRVVVIKHIGGAPLLERSEEEGFALAKFMLMEILETFISREGEDVGVRLWFAGRSSRSLRMLGR